MKKSKGKNLIVMLLIAAMIIGTAPTTFGADANSGSDQSTQKSEDVQTQADQNAADDVADDSSQKQKDSEKTDSGEKTDSEEIVFDADNLTVTTDDLKEKGEWTKDGVTIEQPKDKQMSFTFKGTFPEGITKDKKLEIRIPEGVKIDSKDEINKVKTEEYKDDEYSQDGTLVTYTFGDDASEYSLGIKATIDKDTDLGKAFVLQAKAQGGDYSTAKQITVKAVAAKDTESSENTNSTNDTKDQAKKSSKAAETKTLNDKDVDYSGLPDSYEMKKGKADDGWYKNFKATYTDTSTGIVYSTSPSGDEQSLGYNWVDDKDNVKGNSLQGTAGIYKMRAKFYINKLNTESGNYEEVQLGYSNTCTVTVKGTNITFTSPALYFSKNQVWTEQDLRKFVTCTDYKGNAQPYYIKADNFDTINTGSWNIRYFAVDKDTLDEVNAYRTAYVRDAGVYFNTAYPTGQLNDSTSVSYQVGENVSDPLPSDLLTALKSYFYKENGTKIDTNYISVNSQGGYDNKNPIPEGKNSAQYKITYHIDGYPSTAETDKTITVNISKKIESNANFYFDNWGNTRYFSARYDSYNQSAYGGVTGAVGMSADTLKSLAKPEDGSYLHWNQDVDGESWSYHGEDPSKIDGRYEIEIDTSKYDPDVAGLQSLPMTFIFRASAESGAAEYVAVGELNVNLQPVHTEGNGQMAASDYNGSINFNYYPAAENGTSYFGGNYEVLSTAEDLPEVLSDDHKFTKKELYSLGLNKYTAADGNKYTGYNQQSTEDYNNWITVDYNENDLTTLKEHMGENGYGQNVGATLKYNDGTTQYTIDGSVYVSIRTDYANGSLNYYGSEDNYNMNINKAYDSSTSKYNSTVSGSAQVNQGDTDCFLFTGKMKTKNSKWGYYNSMKASYQFNATDSNDYKVIDNRSGFQEWQDKTNYIKVEYDTTGFDIEEAGSQKVPVTITYYDGTGNADANIINKFEGTINVTVKGNGVGFNDLKTACYEGDNVDPKSFVSAYLTQDGSAVDCTLDDDGGFDVNKPGTYTLKYSAVHPTTEKKYEHELTFTVKPDLQFSGVSDTEIFQNEDFDLLKGVTAKTISGNKTVDVKVKDDGGFDNTVPGEYTVTYSAVHPSSNREYTATRKITVKKDGIKITGTEDRTVNQNTDVDITEGVEAKTDRGKYMKVIVTDDGGFDAAKVGTYTVKYKATNSSTGETVTAEKKITVAANTNDSKVTINFKSPFTDNSNFVLGGSGQENLILNVKYEGVTGDKGRQLRVKVPKGFEVVKPPEITFSMEKTPTLQGSYTDENGTYFIYTFADDGTAQCSFSFTVKQKLQTLYSDLVEGTNTYDFRADALTGGSYNASTKESTAGNAVMTAKTTLEANGDLPDMSVDNTGNDEVWSPGELFGVSNGGGYAYYNSNNYGSKWYTITVNKEAGKLASPDWKLQFRLPDGLRTTSNQYNYSLQYYSGDTLLATTYSDSSEFKTENGITTIGLANPNKYTFNNVATGKTYADTNRETTKVVLKMRFTNLSGDDTETVRLRDALLMNKTVDESDPADQGVMKGTDISLIQTLRDRSSNTATKKSGTDIAIRLVNPSNLSDSNKMQLRTYPWYGDETDGISSSDYSIGTGKTRTEMNWWTETPGIRSYGVYRGLEYTIGYDYEFSPVSVSPSNNYYKVMYTVKDKDGNVVKDSEEQTNSDSSIALEEGQYVSSVTVKYINMSNSIVNNVDNNGGYAFVRSGRPSIKVKAHKTHADGSLITEDYETTVKYSTVNKYGTEQNVDKKVTVVPVLDNAVISAADQSSRIGVTISPENQASGTLVNGNNDYWFAIDITTSKNTMDYEDPVLAFTGKSVAMANWDNYTSQITAYAVDTDANGDPIWIDDPYDLKVASLVGYSTIDNIVGVKLNIKSWINDNSKAQNPTTHRYGISSKALWSTSKGFTAAGMDTQLNTQGYTLNDFKVQFDYSNADPDRTDKVVTNDTGTTTKHPLGQMATSINTADSNYDIDPYATGDRFYFSTMELQQTNIATTNDQLNSNFAGYHKGATLLYDVGTTDEEKAMMSLTQGVVMDANYYAYDSTTGTYSDRYYNSSATAYYKTNTSGDTWKKATFGYDSKYYIGTGNNRYYASFALGDGEYVTSVKVEYTNNQNRTRFPSIGLVRNKAVPETTPSGFDLKSKGDGYQFTYNNVSFKYDNWTTLATDEDDPVTLNFSDSQKSSRMVIGSKKVINKFTEDISYNPDSVNQSESTTVTAKTSWTFTDATKRVGVSTLRPTVWYKLMPNVNYKSGSIDSSVATAAYYPQYKLNDSDTSNDGDADAKYGMLKITFKKQISSGTSVNFGLLTDYNTEYGPAKQPITDSWLDTAYEKDNCFTDNGYYVTFDSTSSQYQENLGEKKDLYFTSKNPYDMYEQAVTNSIIINEKKETGIATYPTSTAPDGNTSVGDFVTPATGTSSDEFGGNIKVIGDVDADTTDWNIYMNIPVKDSTTQYLDYAGDGSRKTSSGSQFTAGLKSLIDASVFPKGAVISYSKSWDTAKAGLKGGTDAADLGYKTTAQVEAMSSDTERADFLKDVKSIHISVPKMENQELVNFSVNYLNIDKDEIGLQKAYSSLYYNYKVGDNWKYNDYSLSPLMEYQLSDMYISGKVWKEKDYNSLYSGRDDKYAGAKLEVVDSSGNALKVMDGWTGTNNKADSDANGEYKLAVPKVGKYKVTFGQIDKMNLVTKEATGGTAATQSVFDPDSYTKDIEIVYNLEGHELTNINAGLYDVTIDAQDFTYGIDEGNISENASKLLSYVVGGLQGGTADRLDNISVDAAQLKAINDAIAAGTVKKLPLTFTYQPSVVSASVTKTIYVTLRDHGDGAAQKEERITANDFCYGISLGQMSQYAARQLSFVAAIDADGNTIDTSSLIVDETTLGNINDELLAGTIKAGDQRDLKFSTPNGTETTVTVTFKDAGTLVTSKENISANNFEYGQDEAALTADKAKELASVSAVDKDGFPIDVKDLIVDNTTLNSFNAQYKTAVPGTKIPMTYKTAGGTSVTIQITVKSHGTQIKDGETHITANDTFYSVKDKDGNKAPTLSKDEIKAMMAVAATDSDGKAIDVKDISVDNTELMNVNANIDAGILGKFPVTYTTADKVTVTAYITLKGTGVNKDPDSSKLSSIGANDFTYAIRNSADSKTNLNITQDMAKLLSAVQATNDKGLDMSASDIKVDQKMLKVINDAKNAGKVGVYDLKFFTAYEETTIKVTLTDVGTNSNGTDTSIGANDFEYGVRDSDGNTAADITELVARNLSSVIAYDKDGNRVQTDKIEVDKDQLKAINDAIAAGETGPYKLKFTEPGGKEAEITVTLKDIGSKVTTEKGYITGEGFTYAMKDTKTLKETPDITTDEAVRLAQIAAHDNNGCSIDAKDIIVDEDMLAAINQAKHDGKEGVYDLTFKTKDGYEITVPVTLKDIGTNPNEDLAAIAGNDFSYAVRDPEGKTADAITDAIAKKLSDVSATDKNGDPVTVDNIKVDQDQLKAINDAVTAGETGPYKLKFTTDDGVESEITVTLKDNGVNKNDGEESITANNFEYGIKDKNGGAAADISEDIAKMLASTEAFNKDGTPMDLSKVTVDADQLKIINDAKDAGKKDDYELTFKTPDGKTAKIIVSLRDYTDVGKDAGQISANDFMYGIKDKDGKANPDLTNAKAIELAKAVGQDKDGNPIPSGELIVDQTMLKTINDAKAAGKTGTYPLKFTTEEGKTVTVDVTLYDHEGSYTGGEIGGNDFSVGKTQVDGLTDADLIKLGNASAYDENGNPLTVTVKDRSQLKAEPGTYPVTYTATDKDGNEMTITVNVTVKEWTLIMQDPPVAKKVSGDKPSKKGTFKFYMKAKTAGSPMPGSTSAQRLEKTIKGAGSVEFGWMTYMKAGTYVYELGEVDTGTAGYTYDKAEYTMTVVITEGKDGFEKDVTYKKGSKSVSKMTFTNKYDKSKAGIGNGDGNDDGTLPAGTVKHYGSKTKTGDDTTMMPYLLLMIIAAAGAGMAAAKRRKEQ
ncbi:MAG: FctA domain-containing protein [Eubacteriaceae bacterium]|nr:FctA domain-containing protein [Eubacteriaceae bacterium]